MRTNIILVALCALFFSAFHDTLLPLLQTHEHQNIMHCQSENIASSDTQECDKCVQFHSMLHFIAIVMPDKPTGVHFEKQPRYVHIQKSHTPPLQQSSYKPPKA